MFGHSCSVTKKRGKRGVKTSDGVEINALFRLLILAPFALTREQVEMKVNMINEKQIGKKSAVINFNCFLVHVS